MAIIMTQQQFLDKLKLAHDVPNVYDNHFPRNCGYYDAGKGRFSFDCWNLIKSILGGWSDVRVDGYYVSPSSFPTGDCDGYHLLLQCTGISKDFSKICVPGTYLYLSNHPHAGVYIGDFTAEDGKVYNVVECTGAWEGKVLYSYVDSQGRRLRYKGSSSQAYSWTDYGLLTKWIDYTNKPEPQPAPEPPVPYIEYTVQPGDTLSAIAYKYGTTVDAILAINPEITNPNLIQVGQIIKIPTSSAEPSKPNPVVYPPEDPTKGIDIARYQKNLVLASAKRQGYTQVIIKAGGADAGLYQDSMFEDFYHQAKAADMLNGVYFFGNAFSNEDAVKEANYFKSIIDDKNIEYVWYDVEGKMLNQGYDHLTNIIKAFCQTMESYGYKVGIYTSESQFNTRFNDKELSKYYHWVARYSSKAPIITSGNKIDIWQYGGSTNYLDANNIDGVVVDKDYFYTKFDHTEIETPDKYTTVEKSIAELAQDVLAGKYGNGEDRKKALGAKYTAVQAEVDRLINERSTFKTNKSIVQLANEVLAGVWGNNPVRAIKLTAAGYNAKAVQEEVNKIVVSRKETEKPYVVVKGDTLSSIAKRYNTTVKKLVETNKIENPNKIQVGQVLTIK